MYQSWMDHHDIAKYCWHVHPLRFYGKAGIICIHLFAAALRVFDIITISMSTKSALSQPFLGDNQLYFLLVVIQNVSSGMHKSSFHNHIL